MARVGLYAFLCLGAVFFALPLYVLVVTSLKSMPEIVDGHVWSLPSAPNFDAWARAWLGACTERACSGLSSGLANSLAITLPSVVISVSVAAVNGYALTFWRYPGAGALFTLLVVGAFVPYQVLVYPLVIFLREAGLFGSVGGLVLVHTIFGLPILTLLFRNHFLSLPPAVFAAARIDGAGFWRTFFHLALPMSTPAIVVAVLLQVTGIWNDFLLGLVFAGADTQPMTLQLNNLVATTTGTREYNVEMAATLLTAAVPLLAYFASGRWFVRGVASGAIAS